MDIDRIARKFAVSVGAVLLITGTAKIWSSFGQTRVLFVSDPLFSIQYGYLLLLVGATELVIASVCFFCNRQLFSIGLVAWVASGFVVYRLGLLWMGWHRPCSCLGNLTDAIHVSPQLADDFMKGVLAYLLIGSYVILFCLWRRRQKVPPSTPGSKLAAQANS
jgi:hypothetical protein